MDGRAAFSILRHGSRAVLAAIVNLHSRRQLYALRGRQEAQHPLVHDEETRLLASAVCAAFPVRNRKVEVVPADVATSAAVNRYLRTSPRYIGGGALALPALPLDCRAGEPAVQVCSSALYCSCTW